MGEPTIERPRRTRNRASVGMLVLAAALGIGLTGCSTGPDPVIAPYGGTEQPADPYAAAAPDGIGNLPGSPAGQLVGPPPPTTIGLARPMPASKPVRVQIPAIGVDSTLMDLGLQPDRTLQVPPAGFPAGWYTNAPTPGELGPAVIAGHVSWNSRPGVFFDLHDLNRGDQVTVARQDGTLAIFRVVEVRQYPKSQFPTAVVYGDIGYAGLRLITCGGSFDRASGNFNDNIVVFAALVESRAV